MEQTAQVAFLCVRVTRPLPLMAKQKGSKALLDRFVLLGELGEPVGLLRVLLPR